jgi:hypothetical protein
MHKNSEQDRIRAESTMVDGVEPLKEREDGKLHPEDLTVAQFIAVLEGLNSPDNNQCPECGTNNWDVHRAGDLDENGGKPVILGSPARHKPNISQLFYFISCGHCGYMRQFRVENITRLAAKI